MDPSEQSECQEETGSQDHVGRVVSTEKGVHLATQEWTERTEPQECLVTMEQTEPPETSVQLA